MTLMIHRPSLAACLLAAFALLAGACGGSTPASPDPSPTPIPTPVATPTPAPLPTPSPSPTPCGEGLCEEPTNNTNPVASVILRLYVVQDGFLEPHYDWNINDAIPVGYTIRLDVTGKDGYGKDTHGNQGVKIVFFYNDASMVQEGGNHDWQRKLLVKKAGGFQAWAVFDGVRSNTLWLQFKEKP
jgi:hypothetical protein